MNKIELSEQEAQSFIAWRQHQDVFEKLLSLGVFGVRNGSAELHFDGEGNLSNAKLHFTVFQKKVIHTLVQTKPLTKHD